MKSININGWSFTKVNYFTKKAQLLLGNYNRSNDYSLYSVYERPSSDKVKALEDIRDLYLSLSSSYGLKITTYCIFNFTCCFRFDYNGKTAWAYFTKSNNYLIVEGE